MFTKLNINLSWNGNCLSAHKYMFYIYQTGHKSLYTSIYICSWLNMGMHVTFKYHFPLKRRMYDSFCQEHPAHYWNLSEGFVREDLSCSHCRLNIYIIWNGSQLSLSQHSPNQHDITLGTGMTKTKHTSDLKNYHAWAILSVVSTVKCRYNAVPFITSYTQHCNGNSRTWLTGKL